jgi:hypothetical protein
VKEAMIFTLFTAYLTILFVIDSQK